jgi:hypothetical protein
MTRRAPWQSLSPRAKDVLTVLRDHRRIVQVALGGAAPSLDPRDPDPSREGIFRHHNCARCRSGEKPCVRGNPAQCEWPHARND